MLRCAMQRVVAAALVIALLVPSALNAQSVVGSSNTETATAPAAQRKTFQDSATGTQWAFWDNGGTVGYGYLASGAADWVSVGNAVPFATSQFSVTSALIGGVRYVFIAATNGSSIYVVRGVVSATSIAFDPAVAALSAVSADAYSTPTLAVGGDGVLWVAGVYDSGLSGFYDRGEVRVIYSHIAAGDDPVSADGQVLSLSGIAPGVIGRKTGRSEVRDLVLLPQADGRMLLLANGMSGNILGYRLALSEVTPSSWVVTAAESDAAALPAMVKHSWETFGGATLAGEVRALTLSNGGTKLYVGGTFRKINEIADTALVAVLDLGSHTFSSLGGPIEGSAVNAIVDTGTGSVCVGGSFDQAGAATVQNFACWDGAAWSGLEGSFSGEVRALWYDAYNSLIWAGGSFSGGLAARPLTSGSWSSYGLNGEVYALLKADSSLYVGGAFTDAGGLADADYLAGLEVSAAPFTWYALGSGNPLSGLARGAVFALAYDSGASTLYVGGDFHTSISSNDADHVVSILNPAGGSPSWNRYSGAQLGSPVKSLAIFNSQLYVGLLSAKEAVQRTTLDLTAAWQSSGGGVGLIRGTVAALVSGSGLFIGGDFPPIGGDPMTSRLALSADFSAWSGFGPGGDQPAFNNAVNALEFFKGKLYAGGSFTNAGGDSGADYLAVWNGFGWSAVSGFTPENPGPITALAATANYLYVGGEFSGFTAVPTVAQSLVRWDEDTWYSIGGYQWLHGASADEPGKIYAILPRADDLELFVAGEFADVNSVAGTGNIVKLSDNSGWTAQPLQNGANPVTVDGTVYALSAFGAKLYLGGAFTASPVNAHSLAVWDSGGATVWNNAASPAWSALGSLEPSAGLGRYGPVFALAARAVGAGHELFVGGAFRSIGEGVNAVANTANIARWDMNTWQAVGSGFSAPVHALKFWGTSLLAGAEVGAPSTEAYSAGLWNGSAWSPLCSGTDDTILAFAESFDGKSMFVGGRFSVAGDGGSQHFAHCRPVVGTSGPSGGISALAGDDGNVHILFTDTGAPVHVLGYRQYLAGSATWGALTQLASGTVSSPTLSIHRGKRELMAFWLSAQDILLKRAMLSYSPPRWDINPVTVLTAANMAYLTSSVDVYPYAASLLWTSGVSPWSVLHKNAVLRDYPVTGVVVDGSGRPVPGVTVDGGVLGTTTTDLSGRFTLGPIPFGSSYTITISRPGFSFTAPTLTGIAGETPAPSFSGTVVTHTLSGTVTLRGQPLANVQVDGGRFGMTVTDAHGGYSFAAVPEGAAYVIRPFKTGFTFTPPKAEGTLTADVLADFSAARTVFSIRGRVMRGTNAMRGVTIDAGRLGKAVTDREGLYRFENVPAGTEFRLTPSLSGHTFIPPSAGGILNEDRRIGFGVQARVVYGGAVDLVSIASDGTQGDAASGSVDMSCVSADGTARYAAFCSTASALAEGTTALRRHVYLRDRTGATTVLVSRSANGDEGDAASGEPSADSRAVALSSDGAKLAFHSHAANLTADDLNSSSDVFLYDVAAGTPSLVSESTAGAQGDGASWGPAIDADGSLVAFISEATNLVSDDTNGYADIFLRDLSGAVTSRVSVNAGGTEADGASWYPALNSDGSLVVFVSDATNLVDGDTNGAADVFLKNTAGGAVTRVSVSSTGTEANGASSLPAISADGSVIAFASDAGNLVENDNNGVRDVFTYEVATGKVTRVSVSSAGDESDGESGIGEISLSSNGRYVAFVAEASNLIPGGSEKIAQVYVHDRQTSRTGLMSVTVGAHAGNAPSGAGVLSANGNRLVFTTEADNIAADDENNVADVVTVQVGALPEVFQPKAPISTPPSAVVNSKKVTVVMQLFTLVSNGTSGYELIEVNRANAAVLKAMHAPGSRAQQIVYKVTVKSLSKSSDVRRRTTKRNTLTVSKLKPGSYSVRYRAQARSGSTVISQSKQSANRTFTITG